jgi:branched-chain amino acid aminotransferase
MNGFVAETRANFMIIKNGAVLSPTTLNILDGVTRRTVLTLARKLAMRAGEKNLTLGDVYRR